MTTETKEAKTGAPRPEEEPVSTKAPNSGPPMEPVNAPTAVSAGLKGSASPDQPAPLPVPSQSGGGSGKELRFQIMLRSTPEVVFKSLVEPERVTKWFARTAAIEAKAGGSYSIGWAEGQTTKWKIKEFAPGKALTILIPEPVTFRLEKEEDGRTRLELVVGLGLDPMPQVKEQVMWAAHLMYLKGYIDHNVDLRETDPNKKWKDDYVNGYEA